MQTEVLFYNRCNVLHVSIIYVDNSRSCVRGINVGYIDERHMQEVRYINKQQCNTTCVHLLVLINYYRNFRAIIEKKIFYEILLQELKVIR
jgi:hypothetical protein